MPFKKNLFAIVVLILGLSLTAFAQRDTLSINTVIAKAVKYSNDRPIEKVYLQTDKPYYAVGDTIWFKAYLTMDLHLPSTLSKIVYVDLFNGQDSVMETLKLQVVNSVASGRFVLAQTNYKQGNYRLRAYTQWMLNFDAVYLFNKTISVGNIGEDPVITHITFDNAAKNAAAKVDAKILFHDIDEKPFADKKITWRVEIDNDVTSKGKASTDANGAVIINFPPAQLATLTSGILYTVMDLGNRKTVTNSFPLRAATADVDVQFFPEGGSFIGGVRNVLGFKAVKSDGRGVDVKGSVVDNEGKTVISFESQHLGMGEFAMVPDVEKSYKATITLATGAQTTVDLPKVRNGGINLIASNADDDNLIIKLLASDVFF